MQISMTSECVWLGQRTQSRAVDIFRSLSIPALDMSGFRVKHFYGFMLSNLEEACQCRLTVCFLDHCSLSKCLASRLRVVDSTTESPSTVCLALYMRVTESINAWSLG